MPIGPGIFDPAPAPLGPEGYDPAPKDDWHEGYDPAPNDGLGVIAENEPGYPDLPTWQGGKAVGVLDTGSEQIPLISGYNGPSSTMPDDAPGMSIDLAVRSHVEAHAAAIMRQLNLSEATLYINKSPCEGPYGCDNLLPHMLPENSTLNVHVMDSKGNWSSRTPYHGLPDDDWSHVRGR